MARGCSSMVEHQPSKLDTRVRFPSPAPRRCGRHIVRSDFLQKSLLTHSVAAPFSFKTHGFEADFCFLASVTSLALTFIHSEKSHGALVMLPFLPKSQPRFWVAILLFISSGKNASRVVPLLLLSGPKPEVSVLSFGFCALPLCRARS